MRDYSELLEAASHAAREAGKLLLDRFHAPAHGVETKSTPTDPVSDADRDAEKLILEIVGARRPDDGVVAEEGGGKRSRSGYRWIVDLEVARTGLREAEAVAAGFDYVSAVVGSKTRAGYYPGAAKMKTKLVVEKRSGRLLGAQIVGLEGAAKRIDVLACALWNEMAVDELQNLDLSYAPPFAPVWDPVLIAARKAWEKVEAGLASGT